MNSSLAHTIDTCGSHQCLKAQILSVGQAARRTSDRSGRVFHLNPSSFAVPQHADEAETGSAGPLNSLGGDANAPTIVVDFETPNAVSVYVYDGLDVFVGKCLRRDESVARVVAAATIEAYLGEFGKALAVEDVYLHSDHSGRRLTTAVLIVNGQEVFGTVPMRADNNRSYAEAAIAALVEGGVMGVQRFVRRTGLELIVDTARS